jgi:hypothetical protein
MKLKPQLVAVLLIFAPTVLHADPIADSPFDVQEIPRIWGALLLEVLVVAYFLRRTHLRTVRFMAVWFAVNLLTFYVLLPISIKAGWSVMAGEFVVFVFEAAMLVVVSRWGFLRTAESKTVSILMAIAISFVGNATSIVAYGVLDAMR